MPKTPLIPSSPGFNPGRIEGPPALSGPAGRPDGPDRNRYLPQRPIFSSLHLSFTAVKVFSFFCRSVPLSS